MNKVGTKGEEGKAEIISTSGNMAYQNTACMQDSEYNDLALLL